MWFWWKPGLALHLQGEAKGVPAILLQARDSQWSHFLRGSGRGGLEAWLRLDGAEIWLSWAGLWLLLTWAGLD